MYPLPNRPTDAGPLGSATPLKWDEAILEAIDFGHTALDYACDNPLDEAKMRESLLRRAEQHIEDARMLLKQRILKLEQLRGLIAPQPMADQRTACSFVLLSKAGVTLADIADAQKGMRA